MKRVLLIVIVLSAAAIAQDANPVVAAGRKQIMERSHHMVEAAKLMPADKYEYKATPTQMTFGHLVVHAVRATGGLCALAAGEKRTPPDLKDTDPKDKLVAALEDAVTYCDTALPKVTDKSLGETIKTPWGAEMTRAELLFEINADQADHYSIAAMYLRLNGLLPPTAKK
jgi:DinB family protein